MLEAAVFIANTILGLSIFIIGGNLVEAYGRAGYPRIEEL